MHFDRHSEFGDPPFSLLQGSFQKCVFRRLQAEFPFANERDDFLTEQFFMANRFKVAKSLVHLRVPQVLSNSSRGIYWDRNKGRALIFVSFNGHDIIIVFELADGAPLPRGEVSEAAFLLERETAAPVFVLEIRDALFNASVGEGGCPFRFEVQARDVVDAWLFSGRIKIEEGHATEVITKPFQALVDVVRRSWTSRAEFQALSHQRASPWGNRSFFAQIMKGRIVGAAIELGGSHLTDVIFNIFPNW